MNELEKMKKIDSEYLHSKHDYSFEYTLGKEIVIDDFDLMYNVECASGFHFFRTREEDENFEEMPVCSLICAAIVTAILLIVFR